jgi:hypothetical protein
MPCTTSRGRPTPLPPILPAEISTISEGVGPTAVLCPPSTAPAARPWRRKRPDARPIADGRLGGEAPAAGRPLAWRTACNVPPPPAPGLFAAPDPAPRRHGRAMPHAGERRGHVAVGGSRGHDPTGPPPRSRTSSRPDGAPSRGASDGRPAAGLHVGTGTGQARWGRRWCWGAATATPDDVSRPELERRQAAIFHIVTRSPPTRARAWVGGSPSCEMKAWRHQAKPRTGTGWGPAARLQRAAI